MIEVWCEKSTMHDILEPLCQREHFNLVESTGYESITQTVQFLRRAERYGGAALIIYISDFDPGGKGMPVAVARQIQFWLEEKQIDVDVVVDTAVLTEEQCVYYKLPRTPIKETDRRKDKFEERRGEGATEVDALEALHPGELERIILEHAKPYRDPGLQSRLSRTRLQVQRQLDEAWSAAGGDELAEQMDELIEQANEITERQAERIRAIMAETEELLQPLVEAAEDLDRQAREISSDIEVELPERPQPEMSDVDPDVLFDSRRHWLDQLEVFKARHKKDGAAA
jgi:hypothetical protein